MVVEKVLWGVVVGCFVCVLGIPVGDMTYHNPWSDFQSSISPPQREWQCRVPRMASENLVVESFPDYEAFDAYVLFVIG